MLKKILIPLLDALTLKSLQRRKNQKYLCANFPYLLETLKRIASEERKTHYGRCAEEFHARCLNERGRKDFYDLIRKKVYFFLYEFRNKGYKNINLAIEIAFFIRETDDDLLPDPSILIWSDVGNYSSHS